MDIALLIRIQVKFGIKLVVKQNKSLTNQNWNSGDIKYIYCYSNIVVSLVVIYDIF